MTSDCLSSNLERLRSKAEDLGVRGTASSGISKPQFAIF
jgi:hypothetical protein